MTDSVAVSRRIAAPASDVFAILSDPARHPDIDGSGMLREPGDVFRMRMHNDKMGDYVMANYVVEYERNRRIGWEPEMSEASRPEDAAAVGTRAHHRWTYELTPDGGETVVTEIFDCSLAPEWLRTAVKGGERWRHAMAISLENLEDRCGDGGSQTPHRSSLLVRLSPGRTLRRQPVRAAEQERHVPDRVQAQEHHQEPAEAQAEAAVRRAAVAEAVQVAEHRLGGQPLFG
jgi:uncharacterized protein YndB with AHSA1/START domain